MPEGSQVLSMYLAWLNECPAFRLLHQDMVGRLAQPHEIDEDPHITEDGIEVNLNVEHYRPDEIVVTTEKGFVTVRGKHEERRDDRGFVSREFTRRYSLPECCSAENIVSSFSTDGVLRVKALKTPLNQDGSERSVPVQMTGPVRLIPKILDDDDK